MTIEAGEDVHLSSSWARAGPVELELYESLKNSSGCPVAPIFTGLALPPEVLMAFEAQVSTGFQSLANLEVLTPDGADG